MDGETYEVRSGSGFVEAWSDRRLPFEARGHMRAFRDELRAAIRQLRATDGEGLHATYSSVVQEFYDVENVLIYNVGASAFRDIAQRHLSFERIAPQENDHPHRYRYEIRPVSAYSFGPQSLVATWSADDVPRLSEETKLTALWWAIRAGEITTQRVVEPGTPVHLDVEVRAPRLVNLASIVKVLIDASVVALQSAHSTPRLEELAVRIALRLRNDASDVLRALAHNPHAVLRQGAIARLRGIDSIHWNPADDGCVGASLRHAPSSTWGLRGSLYALEGGGLPASEHPV